jgi:hypothetical protein
LTNQFITQAGRGKVKNWCGARRPSKPVNTQQTFLGNWVLTLHTADIAKNSILLHSKHSYRQQPSFVQQTFLGNKVLTSHTADAPRQQPSFAQQIFLGNKVLTSHTADFHRQQPSFQQQELLGNQVYFSANFLGNMVFFLHFRHS